MAKKRFTPQDEIDRLADNLWNAYGDEIEDIDSYNESFNKYLEVDKKALTHKQDTELREEVFDTIRSKHKDVIPEHLPLKIVPMEDEGVTALKEKGKLRKAESFEVSTKKPQFTIVGSVNIKHPKSGEKIGYKVVYSREISFKMNGKYTTRLIDRYGRFVSRIKEE